MDAGADIVAKGEFARLTNVTPGRVSQWISEGKISGEALVGEGRNARIRVALAKQQLRDKIDVGQRFGNGLSTRIAEQQPAIAVPSIAPAPQLDSVEEQIKRAKLEEITRRNEKAAEEAAARAGRYVSAEASRQEMGRIAGQTVSIIEGALPEFATALAAKFPQVPQRDALHLLRQEFRQVRARAATNLRAAMEGAPQLVEDEIADASAAAEEAPAGEPADED